MKPLHDCRSIPRRGSSAIVLGVAMGLAVLTLISNGCIVGPDHCLPATPAPDQWHQTLQQGEYTSPQELCEWWTMFDDPLLNHLVTYAGEHNLDLHTATTRIWQACAQRCITASIRYSQINAIGSLRGIRQSSNIFNFGPMPFQPGHFNIWSVGFDSIWEPNLFGRITRLVEAADANLCASVEDYRDVLVTLYGEVARAYVEARTIQSQIDYARRNIETQKQALELARKRVEGGVSPVLDQYQAESLLARTEAELPPLEQRLQYALNRLSVLMGEYPGSLHQLLCPPRPIPTPPAELPITVPCDVIRQRPDIRAAERRVAARCAEIGVAIADLYPRFSLGGTIQMQAQDFADLFDGSSLSYQLGPSFTWPIFHGRRILCNIERAQAATEEAIAIYQQTILLAAEEIENAIIAYNKELRRRDSLKEAVVANQKSLESVLELYRGGKTNFQNVLDTQRSLVVAQIDLAGSEGQVVLNLIALYKALGGGWDPDHHCDRGDVRLRCPDRAPPELCDELAAAKVRNAEELSRPDRRNGQDGQDSDTSPRSDLLPSPKSTDEPSTDAEAKTSPNLFRLPRIRVDGDFPSFRPFRGREQFNESTDR